MVSKRQTTIVGATNRGKGSRVTLSACHLVTVSACHLVTLSGLLIAGCDLPGKPKDRPVAAGQVEKFGDLYAARCAGCHGADGKLGPAPPLNDPIFRAIVPEDELLLVIRAGRTVTASQKSAMPAFGVAPLTEAKLDPKAVARQRGPLTDAQIQVLAEGIKKHWGAPASGSPPPYIGKEGDEKEGARLFARACADCHGPQGAGTKDRNAVSGGRINDQAFLALISDKALRRIIITGRPDLGMPAYNDAAGRPKDFQPLSSQQIDDLVALLASWRRGDGADKK